MTEVKAIGYVKDGKFTTVLKSKLESEIKQLKDGDYNITIKRRGRRSDPQNRYYWGVVVAMFTAEFRRLGNDVDEDMVHEVLKQKFNSKKLQDADGTVIEEIGGSTAQMSKWDMMEYLDKIVAWALNGLDLNIPPPNIYYDINELI